MTNVRFQRIFDRASV